MVTANDTDGLLYACCLDGKGGGRRLAWEEIEQWTPQQGLLWVHMDYTHPAIPHRLQTMPTPAEGVYETLLLDETRPRIDIMDEGMLLILRGVNTNPGADPVDMVSIRIWLTPECIISTRMRRLRSVTELQELLDKGRGPTNASAFLTQLLDRLGNQITLVVGQLEEEIDAIEVELSDSQASISSLRPRLSLLRREAAQLRRHLAPQRDALERLYREQHPLIDNSTRIRLREATDQFRRYVEELDLARERALVAHEQLQATIAEQQNQRMFILSVVAAIFLPLGFVTGLLGMNVGGIPGEGKPWAFSVLLGLMLITATGLIALFRWRRWF